MARVAADRPAYYQKSLLTYFDILGFREIVASAADPEQVASKLRVFSRLSQPERGEMEKWQHTFSHFSDLAVRNVPIKVREELGVEQGLLYWELLDLAYIQSHLAEDGILIRGATTVGDIYVDERLIFGPALIRAYELERDVASYPRIILDSRVLADGTALDGQVVILAEDEVTAKARTQSWLAAARPWMAGPNNTRQIQRSDVAEPEELETFYGYGIGTKPLFWEMHTLRAKKVQSA